MARLVRQMAPIERQMARILRLWLPFMLLSGTSGTKGVLGKEKYGCVVPLTGDLLP